MRETYRRLSATSRWDNDQRGLLILSTTGALEAFAQWCYCRYRSRVISPPSERERFLEWLLYQHDVIDYCADEDADLAKRRRVFFSKLVGYLGRRTGIPSEFVEEFRKRNSTLRAPFAHGDPIEVPPREARRYVGSAASCIVLVLFEQFAFAGQAQIILMNLGLYRHVEWWSERMRWIEDRQSESRAGEIIKIAATLPEGDD